ncbi:MAG: glycosyltransferase family 39 protein [Planctomycetia bacterium]|nr:glycosyltransferase family 39 protein [Planctomycetia bacterium]
MMRSGHLDGAAWPGASIAGRRESVWRERELYLLVLLVLGVYFSRLTDLTIRGEESRWARVAHEMMESGDWIVPRQQGAPFPDRPPLNSWAIIGASKLTGQLNLAAIRLPSVLATLLTTLLIYFYSRNFLARIGAFGSAAAFATMAQVLQLGRVAESDALLTVCAAGALFSWHYGYACRNSPPLAWIAGYALAALAGLAKGPQGPVYFVAITSVFLCCRRDWQFLFNRWHLAGFTGFALIIGAWQLPFYLALDAASAQAVWSEGGEVGVRFQYHSLGRALEHWVSYPFEVLICMLPWSLMLSVLPTRWFWRDVGEARPMAMFLLTACAVAFPTCWLPASSRARYFMSLYPCVAPLVGLAIQRCWESPQVSWCPRSWDRYLVTGAGLIAIAGFVVCTAHAVGGSNLLGLGQSVSTGFALAYAVGTVAATAAILWSRMRHDHGHALTGILAVAGFMGLSYTGVVVDMQIQTSNDPSAQVAAVREKIPPGEHLVSFNRIHHLFAYYFQQPIELLKLCDHEVPSDTTASYFCFGEGPDIEKIEIPFAWDRIAVISCERARSSNPSTIVVVGKRRTTPADAQFDEDVTARKRSFYLDLDSTAAQIRSDETAIQD